MGRGDGEQQTEMAGAELSADGASTQGGLSGFDRSKLHQAQGYMEALAEAIESGQKINSATAQGLRRHAENLSQIAK